MTTQEMISTVKTLVENDSKATDQLVGVYLSQAEATILSHLYRAYGAVPPGSKVPPINQYDQCELASRYFLRRGAQGEDAHSENGVNRSYGSVDDADILKRIMPYAYVPGKGNGTGGNWV